MTPEEYADVAVEAAVAAGGLRHAIADVVTRALEEDRARSARLVEAVTATVPEEHRVALRMLARAIRQGAALTRGETA